MWEHAHYLQYKNVKADYVKAFWNVVNWPDVQQRFHRAIRAADALTVGWPRRLKIHDGQGCA